MFSKSAGRLASTVNSAPTPSPFSFLIPHCCDGAQSLCNQKMQRWLPPTRKAKLLRQVLVPKEGGFIQVLHNLGEWWTPSQRPSPSPPAQALGSYRDREGRAFFYPTILLAFGVLGSCPFTFIAFGILSSRTHCAILASGKDSLMLLVYSKSEEPFILSRILITLPGRNSYYYK